MDITFNCDKCGQSLTIDEAGAGQLVDCPKCGTSLLVPDKPIRVETTSPPTLATGSADSKQCPFCAETIRRQAVVCPHCHRDLPTAEAQAILCPHCGRSHNDLPVSLKEARENLEREMILFSLRKHSWKVAAAATELGLARPTLYELMDKLNIQRPH
jgi:DNA-directed RNA polymerase subunit RPC12/RpoP